MAKNSSSSPKTKDTVRQRKKAEASAVQKFLPIAEIRQDTVHLKNGGIRAVLAVSSMNFSLKSEDEQRAIIASYQQFVNTITFPIQIIIRSTKLNVDAYVKDIESRASKMENPLLREQTIDYARFIERLVDVSDIMQKRFFITIPVDPPGVQKTGFLGQLFGFLGSSDTRDKALSRKRQFENLSSQLRDRVNIVSSGLEGLGLKSERLSTSELIELFYQVYNPVTSQDQKLPGLGDLNLKEYLL